MGSLRASPLDQFWSPHQVQGTTLGTVCLCDIEIVGTGTFGNRWELLGVTVSGSALSWVKRLCEGPWRYDAGLFFQPPLPGHFYQWLDQGR